MSRRKDKIIVRKQDIKMKVVPDPEGESGDAVGVMAVITLRIPFGKDFILAPVKSPGLWDVEGADEAYLKEIYEEEKATLIDMLDGLTVEVE